MAAWSIRIELHSRSGERGHCSVSFHAGSSTPPGKIERWKGDRVQSEPFRSFSPFSFCRALLSFSKWNLLLSGRREKSTDFESNHEFVTWDDSFGGKAINWISSEKERSRIAFESFVTIFAEKREMILCIPRKNRYEGKRISRDSCKIWKFYLRKSFDYISLAGKICVAGR